MRTHESYVNAGFLGGTAKAKNRAKYFPELFWKRVKIGTLDQCWNWFGPIGKTNGYGKLGKGNKTVTAHRIAWELSNGPIPKSLCVLHHCDNKICCNPKHLFLGTNKDNQEDAFQKGRSYMGEKHWKVKLNPTKISEIRRLAKLGHISGRNIAKMFEISYEHFCRIKARKAWRHVHP